MDKELLKATMREYKKASGVDYAITTPDSLGDCNSCVNYALADKYGEESKGVWVRHWNSGMNRQAPIEQLDTLFIAHDITEDQANILYNTFSKAFRVFPEVYNEHKCYQIFDKDADIYEVSYTDTETERTYQDLYASKRAAMHRAECLVEWSGAKDVTINRM